MRDQYPELSDKPYNDELNRLFEERKQIFSSKRAEKEPTDLATIQIDPQFLSRELSLTEIGFIPETDQLIRIAAALSNTTVEQFCDSAMNRFNNGTIRILTGKVADAVQRFLSTGQCQSQEKLQFWHCKKSDAQLQWDCMKMKLPHLIQQQNDSR